MARPSKYDFKEARKLTGHCVYVFLDCGEPVYIGKTKNIRKRFEPYAYLKCHNEKLNLWLSKKSGNFEVLIYRADDIDALEKSLISKHKSTLFNISDGSENCWFTQNANQKPWVAGRGILSPISDALRRMADDDKKQAIISWLKSVSDLDRCVAEIQTAAMLHYRYKRWAELTRDKMLVALGDTNA